MKDEKTQFVLAKLIHSINGLWKPTPLHRVGRNKTERIYNAGLVGAIGEIEEFMKKEITEQIKEKKEGIELSKCCNARASWNFCFKSCDKCGRKFELKNLLKKE